MKNVYKFCAVCIIAICFFAFSQADAQCALISSDSNGILISISVSCDIPVLISTGNIAADDSIYQANKSIWISNNQEAYEQWEAAASYFEIHQADFDAMPAERQDGISKDPNLFHIIQ